MKQSNAQGASRGWIGVDLDGTLAEYHGWQGPEHIGAPIAPMVELVKRLLAEGHDVRIMTARVSHDGTWLENAAAIGSTAVIRAWCETHIGVALPVTCMKDFGLIRLYDDRAVQVEHNTGRLIGVEAFRDDG